MKYFYTFSILLFIQFSSAELAPMFLECGKCSKQSCDGISELNGKANTLIKIKDLPNSEFKND